MKDHAGDPIVWWLSHCPLQRLTKKKKRHKRVPIALNFSYNILAVDQNKGCLYFSIPDAVVLHRFV